MKKRISFIHHVVQIVKYICISILFISITACGGSSKNESTTEQQIAIDKIKTYNTTGEVVPTLIDYKKAGVIHITNDILNDLNEIIKNKSPEEIDTTEEIQAIVNSLTIRDTIKPIITIIGDTTIILNIGDSYVDAGAIATDNIDGNITATIQTINNVNTAIEGNYTVTYNVSDIAGNTADSITRTVEVKNTIVTDTVKPIITLIGDTTITLNVGDSYVDEGAIAIDNIDGNITTKIQVINNINTSIEGNYTVTYNVSDIAGNIANTIIRNIEVTTILSNIPKIYENAEDGNISKWIISGDYNTSTIENIYDISTSSRVIKLNGKFNLREWKHSTFTINIHEMNSTIICWSMKEFGKTIPRLYITTKNGPRSIWYNSSVDSGNGLNKNNIFLALNSHANDEKWHTFTRDINMDIKRYEPDNELISIDHLDIIGVGGLIDNIKLYNSKEDLDIQYPPVINKPGVVFTFDDSLIESWYAFKDEFKNRNIVATFFCNSWESKITGNKDFLAKFKELENDGHEIGYHTKNHAHTQDDKFKNTIDKAQAYLDQEITPEIDMIHEDSFLPSSFSYPFSSGTAKHNDLIREYFPHIRDFIASIMVIDKDEDKSMDEIRIFLENLKKNKEIGVFISHYIFEKNDPRTGENPYHITKEKLIKIMDLVNELGLESYTFEEAHNIYLNQ